MKQAKPTSIRLYVPAPYSAGHKLPLTEGQAHYLAHVMRLKMGDAIAVFNGKDGEWRAQVAEVGKKSITLQLMQRIKPYAACPDIWLAFAPIKNKSGLMIEKAVELGVSQLLPVITHHAVVRSLALEKLHAHAVEAAEQCERYDVPAITPHDDLGKLLDAWPAQRLLLYGDETGGGVPLKLLLPELAGTPAPLAVLIGPEGGFSTDEHRMLRAAPFARPFSMGPRILRADTAAVAALACMQAWLGDWEQQPHFESKS